MTLNCRHFETNDQSCVFGLEKVRLFAGQSTHRSVICTVAIVRICTFHRISCGPYSTEDKLLLLPAGTRRDVAGIRSVVSGSLVMLLLNWTTIEFVNAVVVNVVTSWRPPRSAVRIFSVRIGTTVTTILVVVLASVRIT